MLEIRYTPLVSHIMSEVLLDKVNCTEVDLRIDGFFNELIDRGDVIITFDRPTHQEEFILKDMKQPSKIGKFISRQLIDHSVDNPFQQIWFTRKPRQIFNR
jgi:hypothetical protein